MTEAMLFYLSQMERQTFPETTKRIYLILNHLVQKQCTRQSNCGDLETCDI